jgi:hypothetical protein
MVAMTDVLPDAVGPQMMTLHGYKLGSNLYPPIFSGSIDGVITGLTFILLIFVVRITFIVE